MKKVLGKTERKIAFKVANYYFHDLLLQLLKNLEESQIPFCCVDSTTFSNYQILRAYCYRFMTIISKQIQWNELAGEALDSSHFIDAFQIQREMLMDPEERISLVKETLHANLLKQKESLEEIEHINSIYDDDICLRLAAIKDASSWTIEFENERSRVFSLIDGLADIEVDNAEQKIKNMEDSIHDATLRMFTLLNAPKINDMIKNGMLVACRKKHGLWCLKTDMEKVKNLFHVKTAEEESDLMTLLAGYGLISSTEGKVFDKSDLSSALYRRIGNKTTEEKGSSKRLKAIHKKKREDNG